jgi:hypothetical protein
LFLLEKGAVQTFRTSGTKKLIIADLKPPQCLAKRDVSVGVCITAARKPLSLPECACFHRLYWIRFLMNIPQ